MARIRRHQAPIPGPDTIPEWQTPNLRAAAPRVLENMEARRALATALVPHLDAHSDRSAVAHPLHGPAVLGPDDLRWCIDQACTASPDLQDRWVEICLGLLPYDGFDSSLPDLLRETIDRGGCPAAFRDWQRSVLSDEWTTEAAARWRQGRALSRSNADEPNSRTVDEFVRHWLNRELGVAADSSSSAWECVLNALLCSATSWDAPVTQVTSFEPVNSRSLWASAPADVREPILDCAARWLSVRAPFLANRSDEQGWPAELGDHRDHLAFQLLERESPDRLSAMSNATWADLAPSALASGSTHSDGQSHRRLLRIAAERAREPLYRAAERIIASSVDPGFAQFLRALPHLVGACGARWLSLVRSASHPSASLIGLLGMLLAGRVPGAAEYALSLLDHARSRDHTQRERAQAAALALLHESPGEHFGAVMRAAESSPEWGEHLMGHWAYGMHREWGPLDELTEEHLCRLGGWLHQRTPRHEIEALHSGIYTIERARIDLLPNCLHTCAQRGSPESVSALRLLAGRDPADAWLRGFVLEAEEAFARSAWRKASIAELRDLAEQHQRRLVRSSEELADLIAESLEEFESDLQGEAGIARNLWDETRPGHWEHKNEEHFSDNLRAHLARHLGGRIAGAHREPQIRPPSNDVPGARGDLVVTAHVGEGNRAAQVFIEVKGSWNRKVDTAMKSQLADRYVARTEGTAGIYVVGWFASPGGGVEGRGGSLGQSIGECRESLARQADELSRTLGRRIVAVVLDCSLR